MTRSFVSLSTTTIGSYQYNSEKGPYVLTDLTKSNVHLNNISIVDLIVCPHRQVDSKPKILRKAHGRDSQQELIVLGKAIQWYNTKN